MLAVTPHPMLSVGIEMLKRPLYQTTTRLTEAQLKF